MVLSPYTKIVETSALFADMRELTDRALLHHAEKKIAYHSEETKQKWQEVDRVEVSRPEKEEKLTVHFYRQNTEIIRVCFVPEEVR